MKKEQRTYLLKLDKDKYLEIKAQAKDKNMTFKAYLLTHFIKP